MNLFFLDDIEEESEEEDLMDEFVVSESGISEGEDASRTEEKFVRFIVKEDDSSEVKLTLSGDQPTLGKLIFVYEDEEMEQEKFQDLKLGNNPRSLLKAKTSSESSVQETILFCSVCKNQFVTMNQFLEHVAKEHKSSRFFTFPNKNPHKNCKSCQKLCQNYEDFYAENSGVLSRNLVFPCPHCKRRFVGHFSALERHLFIDHRHCISTEDSSDLNFQVKLREDLSLLKCDFCCKDFMSLQMVNKHLTICTDNAFLHCQICGKRFARDRDIREHLLKR